MPRPAAWPGMPSDRRSAAPMPPSGAKTRAATDDELSTRAARQPRSPKGPRTPPARGPPTRAGYPTHTRSASRGPDSPRRPATDSASRRSPARASGSGAPHPSRRHGRRCVPPAQNASDDSACREAATRAPGSGGRRRLSGSHRRVGRGSCTPGLSQIRT